MQILAQSANSKFPNPKDKKYKFFPWQNIAKDYTYAVGATDLVKEFNSIMENQKETMIKLQEKSEGNAPNFEIGL